jgi:NAD(P)-dependent dehydrogenase (short-subunit alcohol dehydrogenase family)
VLAPADYSQEIIERTAARTLLNRWGSPENVAQAVKFLIEADYITAETIRVDGGEHYGHRKT